MSQRPRLWTWSKAICAGPLCEAPSLCRGRRTHHARKERVGTWEASCLPAAAQAVPGRVGKSARTTPAMDGHEESDGCIVPSKPANKAGRAGGGGGGGKAPDRGEGGATNHAPDTVPALACHMRHHAYGPKWDRPANPSPPTGPSSPEIGARCGKAARRDLRGGRGATRFPTATHFQLTPGAGERYKVKR
jgi:hypothetical protein